MKVNHRQSGKGLAPADRDVITLGIAVAAAILFVGTGGSLMPQIMRAWFAGGEAPDMLLINAVLLNIALLVFGWRRYNDLRREIQERRRAEESARALAETDPLTACLNRRSALPAIEKLLSRTPERSQEFALLMFDLDNFKQINDLYGHQTGDLVLAEAASRTRAMMPVDGLLARMGGDEFLCIFPYDPNDTDRVDAFVANLIAAIAAPMSDKGSYVEATVSVGIATTTNANTGQGGMIAEELANRADIAMYHSKQQGRNRYSWFELQMEHELRARKEMETAIRAGILTGEFVPFFEQQIDLASGELVGFEMLARWNSKQFGLVSPEVFIPLAEKMDVIAKLSEGLIRQALQEARYWHPRLTLSVNISPVQMRDPWFAQKLLQLLVEAGFPPQRLEVEITESCLHENIAAVRSIITSLKNQGVCISLDDFGTGYSSLAQLRSLPFDRLKIDRSFMAELTEAGGNTELFEAIVALGRGLALPVTAEGVESAEMLAALKNMGSLKGQGFLYGQPEDAATTRARLADLNLLAATPPVVQVLPVNADPQLPALQQAG